MRWLLLEIKILIDKWEDINNGFILCESENKMKYKLYRSQEFESHRFLDDLGILLYESDTNVCIGRFRDRVSAIAYLSNLEE